MKKQGICGVNWAGARPKQQSLLYGRYLQGTNVNHVHNGTSSYNYIDSRRFSFLSTTTSTSLLPCNSDLLSNRVPLCPQRRIQDTSNANPNSKHGVVRISKRYIQSEREYLTIVTDTLQTIHDTIDSVLDQQSFITDYEISFSQGVLTLKFPPHGTWVINQQTPNLQIWVSEKYTVPVVMCRHVYLILEQ
jgi:Frataxin-like domain